MKAQNLKFIVVFAIVLITSASTFSQSTELVSVSTDLKSFGTFYDSTSPVIGGIGVDDGRYTAFMSSAPGLGGSSGRKRQIIWRDRKLGITRLVSAGMDGKDGNGDSVAPAISADGLFVAYESYATNLVPIDTNGVRDIFVWNSRSGVTTAVSTGPGEIETNSESFEPTISGDGRLIAYSSSASNIAPGVVGTGTVNIFLKDMRGGAPRLITADAKTKKGVGGSRPSISEDGSKIAFCSFASTLTDGDKNNLWDIFVWDAASPKIKRVSLTTTGGERDQGTESASRVVAPTISGDGNVVVFSTTAGNMFGGDFNKGQDVFLALVPNGMVIPLSAGPNAAAGAGDSPIGQGEKIGLSYNGTQVAFTTNAKWIGGSIVVMDLGLISRETPQSSMPVPTSGGQTDIRRIVTAAGTAVGPPSVSRSGNCVVFGTAERLDTRFQTSGIFVKCKNK